MVHARCIVTCRQATGEGAAEASNAPRLRNPKVLLPGVGGGNPCMHPSKSAFSEPRSLRKAAIPGSVQYLQCLGHSMKAVAPTCLQCLATSSNPSQRRQWRSKCSTRRPAKTGSPPHAVVRA
eukprot:4921045-Alexandrium_andersonii.AAC.1